MTFLVPLAILVLLWWAWKAFPTTIRPLYEQLRGFVGQMLLYAIAVGLLMQGRIMTAAVVAAVGIWLTIGGNVEALKALWRGKGRAAVFRSPQLELTMPPTGGWRGRVRAGDYSGRDLAGLSPEESLNLARRLATEDSDGYRLLESYLDRQLPGWRQHMHAGPGPREGTGPGAAVMTQQEAHEILGVEPGATEEAISEAYRTLMKKLHPDHGGTAWLAARINLARDVLIGRHR